MAIFASKTFPPKTNFKKKFLEEKCSFFKFIWQHTLKGQGLYAWIWLKMFKLLSISELWALKLTWNFTSNIQILVDRYWKKYLSEAFWPFINFLCSNHDHTPLKICFPYPSQQKLYSQSSGVSVSVVERQTALGQPLWLLADLCNLPTSHHSLLPQCREWNLKQKINQLTHTL